MSKELEVIVKESGLNVTKAQVILDKFKDYFEIASEWEIKAKAIVVTNESQTAEMEMAKVGRKFLAKKRIDVEKTRKELKEQSLREGKAIDGISNILKALIVPIEEHLKKQDGTQEMGLYFVLNITSLVSFQHIKMRYGLLLCLLIVTLKNINI